MQTIEILTFPLVEDRRSLGPISSIRKSTALRLTINSQIFLQQFLHRRHIQHLIGDDPLQLGVLDLKLLEALGLSRFEPAMLLVPRIECRRPMQSAKGLNACMEI